MQPIFTNSVLISSSLELRILKLNCISLKLTSKCPSSLNARRSWPNCLPDTLMNSKSNWTWLCVSGINPKKSSIYQSEKSLKPKRQLNNSNMQKDCSRASWTNLNPLFIIYLPTRAGSSCLLWKETCRKCWELVMNSMVMLRNNLPRVNSTLCMMKKRREILCKKKRKRTKSWVNCNHFKTKKSNRNLLFKGNRRKKNNNEQKKMPTKSPKWL